MSEPSAYRPLRSLSLATAILLGAKIVSTLLSVVALSILDAAFASGEAWRSRLAPLANDALTPLRWLGVLLSLATAITFLYWLHRGHTNLPALGSVSKTMSPAEAVQGWFIPFANLVRGYASVRHLWIESQPEPAVLPSGVTLPRRATLVGWWWTAYLSACILPSVFQLVRWQARPVWMLLSVNRMMSALAILAAVLCARVVLAIDRRQREQHDELVRRASPFVAPPDRPL